MNAKWPIVRLGDVIQEKKEPVGEINGNSFPVFGVTNIRGVTQTGVEASEDRSKYLRLRPGYFVYNPYRVNVGSLGVSSQTQDGIVSPAYVVFAPTEKINHKFLYYFLKSPRGDQLINFYGNRGSVRSALRFDDLCQIEISLPQVEEQQQIVVYIEELTAQVQEARALRHQAVEEAEALTQSYINQILEQMVKSKSCKLAFLPEFVEPIRHAIKRGPFGSHLRKEFFVPSGYKVYEQKHAIYGDFTTGSYYIDEEKFGELKAFEVKPGDLIVSCSGTIGKVAIVPDNAEPGIINQALLKITLDTSKIDRRFFKFVFESDFIKKEVTATSPGSAMKNIGSVRILERISFPLPTLNEQRYIVAELDALQAKADTLKSLQTQAATELDALMPSVLDRAFKGEL